MIEFNIGDEFETGSKSGCDDRGSNNSSCKVGRGKKLIMFKPLFEFNLFFSSFIAGWYMEHMEWT